MAKFAGLPWDLVMSAELFEHYKPDPETYLGAAKLLCLPPEQVMMVAAHNHDLKAAQKLGLKTAFVARPTEYGPLRNTISRPRATGTSSPRILAGSPTGWAAKLRAGRSILAPSLRGSSRAALDHAEPAEALIGLVAGRGVERDQRAGAVLMRSRSAVPPVEARRVR